MSLSAGRRLDLQRGVGRFGPKNLSASVRYRSTWFAGKMKAGLRRGLKLCLSLRTEEDAVSSFLRRGLWKMNRSYRPSADVSFGGAKEFYTILARIAEGGSASPSELLPYLCLEGRGQRAEVNAMLADAYFKNPAPERIAQARVFAQRAWLLGDFSPQLFPLYADILRALGDQDAFRDAHKRAGLRAAKHGDVASAIRHFTEWQYAYFTFERLDRFDYDFDVLACIDELAAARQPERTFETPESVDGRVRLAYLLRGVTELNSVLMKHAHGFAELHDRSRFEVAFFIPEQWRQVATSPQGVKHLQRLEALGWSTFVAPDSEDEAESLLSIADSIRQWRPHLLVMCAALADFSHYFITALHPAPLVVGLVQGPPPQFAPPALDWCIAWSRHPQMDTPVGCSLVDLNLSESEPKNAHAYSKEKLGLPRNARVILSGGRHTKFQDPEHWRALSAVLAEHSEAHYLAVGPSAGEMPFFKSVVPTMVQPRIHLLGWRDDFTNILAAADVVVDTYPNGGGQVLFEAMSYGIPIVVHDNDFMQPFDQTNWSPGEQFLDGSELVVPRGDFRELQRVVSRLLEDDAYRARMGQKCRELAARTNPEHSVRHCEAIYLELLEKRGLAPSPPPDDRR